MISTTQFANWSIKHSHHSKQRAQQRGINNDILHLIIEYGTPFYRQGMTFYTVLEKDIPKYLKRSIREKLKDLVVLLGSEGKTIVTCYRAKNAVKYLKRKSKELLK